MTKILASTHLMAYAFGFFLACNTAKKQAQTLAPPAVPTLHAAEKNPFDSIIFNRCYDGDTCNVTIPDLPAVFGKKLGLRIWGLDTPEIRGRCARERRLALEARDIVRTMVFSARRIELSKIQRGKYFRLVARVRVDGIYLDELLIEEGLAVPYYGGTKTKDWCAP